MLIRRRIESEISGLLVSRAYRSAGAMIHFDFGKMEVSRRRNARAWHRGQYGLMVEHADWVIALNGRPLAASDSAARRIDGVLPRVLGKRVIAVSFEESCSVFRLTGGISLSLTCAQAAVGTKLDNWTVFRGNTAVLALTGKGRLTISN